MLSKSFNTDMVHSLPEKRPTENSIYKKNCERAIACIVEFQLVNNKKENAGKSGPPGKSFRH
jgi:hypothetical protein